MPPIVSRLADAHSSGLSRGMRHVRHLLLALFHSLPHSVVVVVPLRICASDWVRRTLCRAMRFDVLLETL